MSLIDDVAAAIERIYRDDSPRVFAKLVRLLGDFDAAEEAMHEAFAAALVQWPHEENPRQSRGVARLHRTLSRDRHDAADVALRTLACPARRG